MHLLTRSYCFIQVETTTPDDDDDHDDDDDEVGGAAEDGTQHNTSIRNKVLDASKDLSDIRKDVTYLEWLNKLELDAIKGQYGMWTDRTIRSALRPHVVEEMEFQATASTWQKVWRWIWRRE